MSQTLADGQLPTSAGTLYTCAFPISIVAASFENTSGSTTETVVITVVRAGGGSPTATLQSVGTGTYS